MSTHRGTSAVRSPDDDAVGHSHRLPPWLFAGLAVIVLGLVGSLVLVAEQSIATNNRLTALEQYVAGKGAQRDAENSAQNQRIDQAVCSVLDQLTAGGRLDIIRRQYACGPGLPATAPSSSPQQAPPTVGRASPRPAPQTAPQTAIPASTSASSSPRRTSAPPSPTEPALAPPPGPVTTVLCGIIPQLCTKP